MDDAYEGEIHVTIIATGFAQSFEDQLLNRWVRACARDPCEDTPLRFRFVAGKRSLWGCPPPRGSPTCSPFPLLVFPRPSTSRAAGMPQRTRMPVQPPQGGAAGGQAPNFGRRGYMGRTTL